MPAWRIFISKIATMICSTSFMCQIWDSHGSVESSSPNQHPASKKNQKGNPKKGWDKVRTKVPRRALTQESCPKPPSILRRIRKPRCPRVVNYNSNRIPLSSKLSRMSARLWISKMRADKRSTIASSIGSDRPSTKETPVRRAVSCQTHEQAVTTRNS